MYHPVYTHIEAQFMRMLYKQDTVHKVTKHKFTLSLKL